MSLFSSFSKNITIIGMTFLFFAINCNTPFIQKEVAVNQIFVVSSLNAAGTDKITLTKR
jgi:hypothetical protein